jgi:hypothetical protein
MKTQKGFTIILAIIVGLLIIGGGAYLYISSDDSNEGDVGEESTSRWDINEDDTDDDIQYVRRNSDNDALVTDDEFSNFEYVLSTSQKIGGSVENGGYVRFVWNGCLQSNDITLQAQSAFDGDNAELITIAKNISSVGGFNWSIPSNFPNGVFRIFISSNSCDSLSETSKRLEIQQPLEAWNRYDSKQSEIFSSDLYSLFSVDYPDDWRLDEFSQNIDGISFEPKGWQLSPSIIYLYPVAHGTEPVTSGNTETTHDFRNSAGHLVATIKLEKIEYKDIFDRMVASFELQ